MREVVVDRARNDVEVQPLGGAGLLEHEERETLRRPVGQPLLGAEAVALGFGDLLGFLVQEELVVEAFRRTAAEDLADLVAELHRVDEVLARHLVVDVQRVPAHRPVGLPLQLALAAGHRHLDLGAILVLIDDGAGLGVHLQHRHLQHAARLGAERQEGAVGLAPLRPEGRQHHVLHRVVVAQHLQQRRVEAARGVPVGGRLEFVLETEGVEEAAQARVVVVPEALVRAEGIGDLRQRLAEMLGHHLLVGDVVRHLAQAVHVVGEAEEARRHVGETLEGLTHHGRARHLAEGADVRQARRPIARFEEDVAFFRRFPADTLCDSSCLFKGPGAGALGQFSFVAHGSARPTG